MQNAAESYPRDVELLEKNKPRQQRAVKTYEAILEAAGELLCEVGLERISTNLIAERAGVTVPALYRYFPNKYAVLNALGSRLMDRQNEVFLLWHQEHVVGQSPRVMLASLYDLLLDIYEATRTVTGGLEVMHGMQSLVPLQEVRRNSHWTIAEFFGRIWCEQYGAQYTEEMARRSRLAVEVGFLSIQLALEDPRLEPEAALRDGADALRLYLEFAVSNAGVNLD